VGQPDASPRAGRWQHSAQPIGLQVLFQLSEQGTGPAAQSRRGRTGAEKTTQTTQDTGCQVSKYLKFETGSDIGLRDQAIAELFYSSGLRLAELVSLDIDDIDHSSRLLSVTGKGNKTRTVPVGSVALKAIDQWLGVRPALSADKDSANALFTSNRGNRISVRNIQARLKLQGRKSGMHQDVHPHMLRHSFASHMLESSGDLRAVQELLGHANISTTQIYTHLDFQHLAKVYDKAHPRAKRKKTE
jgi:integrase/recombinase XerC